MTISKKGSRKIVVNNTEFRWVATGNDGWISVVIWPSDSDNQKLVGTFDYHTEYLNEVNEKGAYVKLKGQILITNRVIREIIDYVGAEKILQLKGELNLGNLALWINDMHIAEIGMAVLSFQGVKYIANIGCEASRKEAKELSEKVVHISVKNKSKNWEPNIEETYPIIKKGVLEALRKANDAEGVAINPPYTFKLELCEGYYYEESHKISWKGSFSKKEAIWEAPSVEIGLEIFNYVRERIRKVD